MHLPTSRLLVAAALAAAVAIAALLMGDAAAAAAWSITCVFAATEFQLARAQNARRADQHHYMSAQPDTDWDHFNESLLFHGADPRANAA